MKKRYLIFVPVMALAFLPFGVKAQKKKSKGEIVQTATTSQKKRNPDFESALNTVGFRKIGPAKTSGRIVDIAVHPQNSSIYYIAAAYGGVWKTENSGITFQQIFDNYNTQSIGCLAIDANNPNIIWVGTGENNNQRSVGYGNGIYKSVDGGKSFEFMGLKNSMHIGMISVNPKNSNDILVAAYGPLWTSGGERGIYQSLDGGKSWVRVLHASEETGFNEIHRDPFNDQILYATAHQRRRHEFTYLGGGPESALYISNDGGKTWNKAKNGFPQGDLGRISLACGKNTYGLIYTIVEGNKDQGGVYVSTDFGASWRKNNSFQTSGNYYQEIFVDPKNDKRLFFMDTYLHVSEDGGTTVKTFPEGQKHVDNHAIWIDPSDQNHLLVGCDGGLYETFNNGGNWHFKENISITQFYRVSVDNSKPFYHVYGGTQDNFSLGGPSRNNTSNGIGNDEWFVTVGGDGFKSQIDPVDPNIIYAQWQYGGLVRFNKKLGDNVDIRPTSKNDETASRWNWDAPLLISKYNHNKLYFASNKVYSSLNQGDSWSEISGDLSRNINRNVIPVMGKQWGIDAIAKNQSTSIYGNITYLAEGQENQLIAGTDDGRIHITQNDGSNWNEVAIPWTSLGIKLFNFSYVEGNTDNSKSQSAEIYPLISSIVFSAHEKDVIFVGFDNHRQGDYKPHVFKVNLKSNTWTRIGNDLPENGSVKTLFEDPKDGNIILVGTEFGLFVSINNGENFTPWMNGLPPIAIKDIAYQSEEDDIAIATFGRGFLICDDYGMLRELAKNENKKILVEGTHKLFIPYNKLGHSGNAYQGDGRFMGENLSEQIKIRVQTVSKFISLKDERKKLENDGNINRVIYPSKEQIINEELEIPNRFYINIYQNSKFVATLNVANKDNWQTIDWNGRHSIPNYNLKEKNTTQWGPFVSPGEYELKLFSMNFKTSSIETLDSTTIKIEYLMDPWEGLKLSEEQRKMRISQRNSNISKVTEGKIVLNSIESKVSVLETIWKNGLSETMDRTPQKMAVYSKWKNLNVDFNEIKTQLYGNTILASHEFESNRGISGEINNTFYEFGGSFQAPTENHMKYFNISIEALHKIESRLNLLETQLNQLQGELK